MPTNQVTVDVSTWTPEAIKDLLDFIIKQDSASTKAATNNLATQQEKDGWTVQALGEMLSRLKISNGAVQAEAIRAALDNGGEVSRSEVYKLGGYDAGRSLKGFTRPVNRVFEEMKADGLLPEEAVHPFKPNYDEDVASYQRAPSFIVPTALVEMWDGQ